MEMIFHSHANKTHLHKKGCVSTWPHFEGEGFWNSEVAYFVNRYHKTLESLPIILRVLERPPGMS